MAEIMAGPCPSMMMPRYGESERKIGKFIIMAIMVRHWRAAWSINFCWRIIKLVRKKRHGNVGDVGAVFYMYGEPAHEQYSIAR